MQAAGYRLAGDKVQFAVKLYEPLTSWALCEISVLIDTNGDKDPEQELAGVPANRLEGIQVEDFKSLLLDATKARQIRKEFEALPQPQKPDPLTKAGPDYTPAVLAAENMTVYHNSSIAIVEVDRKLLATRPSGELAVKIVATAADEYNTESDDYLNSEKKWKMIDISEKSPSFIDLPALVKAPGNKETIIEFTKGVGKQDLMILLPHNSSSLNTLLKDQQMLTPPLKVAKPPRIAAHP